MCLIDTNSVESATDGGRRGCLLLVGGDWGRFTRLGSFEGLDIDRGDGGEPRLEIGCPLSAGIEAIRDRLLNEVWASRGGGSRVVTTAVGLLVDLDEGAVEIAHDR